MAVDFPTIKKTINDFIEDQEGNIPRRQLLTIGSMLVVMGIVMAQNVFAAHRSHSSHSSHKSHVSHSSHYSHTSHGNTHTSHGSHSNTHTSHGSHSNTHTSHSNMPTIPSINIPGANPTSITMPKLSGVATTAASLPNIVEDVLPTVQSTNDTPNKF